MNIPLISKDDRADWVKVLEAMYEDQMALPPEDGHYKTYDKRLDSFLYFSNIDISNVGINEIISYLERTELIEKNPDNENEYGLTQEGLELAHQIKTERQRRKTNIILLALTAILTVLTVGLLYFEVVDANLF